MLDLYRGPDPTGNLDLFWSSDILDNALQLTILKLTQVKLFRRISQPFKKASKNVSKKFDRAVTDVTFLMRDAVTDIDRKFNDFFNMTMEMFEHQHHQVSVSSTFYVRLFRTKANREAFSSYVLAL